MPKKSSPVHLIVLNSRALVVLFAISLLVLFGSFGAWWKYVFTSKERVFSVMLVQNLGTNSITRQVTSDQGGQTVDQYTYLQLSGEPQSRTFVSLTQKENDTITSEVTSETIGTKDSDYSRYLRISTSQKKADGGTADFSKLQNVWSKSDPGTPPQNVQQAALSLVPFANLQPSKRAVLAQKLQDKKIYDVDYGQTKSQTVNGRAVWVYPVKVNIANYIAVFKEIAQNANYGSFDELDSAAYESTPPIELTLAVDKGSRQLVELNDKAGQQKERYSAYGLRSSFALPQTTIPLSELQQQIESVR